MCLSHFAASRRSHPVPWDTLTCRQTRYHLIVSGTDQTVWAEMWQRLPLLLGSSSKNRLCFLVLSRPTEAWTYSLKYFEMNPKRILQMLQPTTLPSRTVSRSMRMGRTLQNYRTSLAWLSYLVYPFLRSWAQGRRPLHHGGIDSEVPWSQFRIVKWRQMHSNAARVGRPSNDTVGDTGIKASYSSTYSAGSIGADQFECLMSRLYSCDSCDMLATRNGMCSARLWNDLSAILEAKCHVQIPNDNVTLCATAVPDVKLEYPI